MRLLLAIFTSLLIVSSSLFSQSLSVFDIDTTNFPNIKAKFYAFDATGIQIKNLSPSDFELTENGTTTRPVTNVTCPNGIPVAVSSVLIFDMSGSMFAGPPRIESAKKAANAWIDGLPTGQSECALVSFDDQSMILHDFTKDRTILKNSIAQLQPRGGTNYNQALIDLPCGGLNIAKSGKNKRVLIFLTDGQPNFEPRTQEIINFANQYQITIYAVTLDMPAPQCIKDVTKQTGGEYFENITTQQEAELTYQKLLQLATSVEPCEITWQSDRRCQSDLVNVYVKLKSANISELTNYRYPQSRIDKLVFSNVLTKFKNPIPGIKVEQKVILTSASSNINVLNIKSNNTAFDINPKTFSLNAGQSQELTVSYLPIDSAYAYCNFEIETNICTQNYYARGGWLGKIPYMKTLKLIHPNGGEKFVIGSDTIIDWNGITEDDKVSLEYSNDNGTSWNLITKQTSKLSYYWKDIPKPISNQCLVRISQLPNIDDAFDKCIQVMNQHKLSVYSVVWSPNVDKVASGSYDKTLRIWDAQNGNCLKIINHNSSVKSVSWNADGDKIATGCENGNVYIWDSETGICLAALNGNSFMINSIAWNPDGKKVASGAEDGKIYIWDVANGTCVDTLNAHTSAVNCIAWDSNGSQIASGGSDSTVYIWDLTLKIVTEKLIGHKGKILSLSWKSDNQQIISGSSDKTIRFWDVDNGNCINSLIAHNSYVYGVQWSPDNNSIITAGSDGIIKIWNAIDQTCIDTLIGHSSFVYSVAWSPDGTKIASGSGDGTIRIWEMNRQIIQQDQSDALFSIVAPEIQAISIDMKECLVNGIKDSFHNNFIQNIGLYKCRIDSIYFTGADANAFSLVSGIPKYEVAAGANKGVEFRFKPTEERTYQAEIVIKTQANDIKVQISGIGVAKKIEVLNNLIDFGIIKCGESKQYIDTATIRNVGKNEISITKITNAGPNNTDFEILNYAPPYTIPKGGELNLSLKFTATSIGRTSDRLLFDYDTQSPPAEVQLYAQAVGGLVRIEDDSAFAGEKKKIRLRLMNNLYPFPSATALPFRARIKYNPTLLTMTDSRSVKSVDKEYEICDVKGTWNLSNGNLLGEFDYIAGLGNATSSYLLLDEFFWLYENGKDINAEVERIDGLFTSLGICHEGGTRLVNPNANIGIRSITPNPAKDKITISAKITEADTKIKLIDIAGKVILEINCPVDRSKAQDFTIDLTNIPAGMYFIEFKSPSFSQVEKVVVEK